MSYYVLIFAFDSTGDKVLLINKRHGPETAQGWNGLGGRIYKNESDGDAAVREFHEESGINIEPARMRCFGEYSGPSFNIKLFATVLADEVPRNRERYSGDEIAFLYWRSLEQTSKTAHFVLTLTTLAWAKVFGANCTNYSIKVNL